MTCGAVLQLNKTPTELVGRFRAQLRREMRSPQLRVNRRRVRELLFLVKMLGLEQLRLVGALRRRDWSRGIRPLRPGASARFAVVEIDQPLILRVLRFLPVGIFRDDLPVNLFRFLRVPQLAMAVARRSASFPRALLRGSRSGRACIPPAPCRTARTDIAAEAVPTSATARQRPASGKERPFWSKLDRFLRHRLVGFPFSVCCRSTATIPARTVASAFKRRLLRFVRERFVVSERVRLSSARERESSRPRAARRLDRDSDSLPRRPADKDSAPPPCDPRFRDNALRNSGRKEPAPVPSIWPPRDEKA